MEIASSLGVSHNNIFYTGIYQHISGDFSGIGSLILKVEVLRSNRDSCALYLLHYCRNVNGRDTEDHVHLICIGNRNQGITESLCLRNCHIHLPVSGNNFFSHFFLQTILKLLGLRFQTAHDNLYAVSYPLTPTYCLQLLLPGAPYPPRIPEKHRRPWKCVSSCLRIPKYSLPQHCLHRQ